jgi:hypothetical protein
LRQTIHGPIGARSAASAIEIAAATAEVHGNRCRVGEQQRGPRGGGPFARARRKQRSGYGELEHGHQPRHPCECRWHHIVGAEGGSEALRVEQLVKRSAREQQSEGAGEQRTNGRIDHEVTIINQPQRYHRRMPPAAGHDE